MDILKGRERSSLLGSVQFDLKKFVNLFGNFGWGNHVQVCGHQHSPS